MLFCLLIHFVTLTSIYIKALALSLCKPLKQLQNTSEIKGKEGTKTYKIVKQPASPKAFAVGGWTQQCFMFINL